MTENEISSKIIHAAYLVHRTLGPGLLESVYEKVLVYQLRKDGLDVANQVPIPIIYDGKYFGDDLRADIIVEKKVIVELKSVAEMKDIFYKQLLTYLRLTHIKLGLLINFNSTMLKDNIHRVANGL